MMRAFAFLAGILLLGGSALAQFGTPGSTTVKEKYTGNVLSGAVEGGATGLVPEGGDEVGVFYKNAAIGVFQFGSSADDGDASYEVTAFGNEPSTEEKDGPNTGEVITFRFFDSSTNTVSNLEAVNSSGERVNVTYQGAATPPVPIELPGFDLTPTRVFDLRVATAGAGGAGPIEGDNAKYDVNGDGKIDVEDSAAVLRIVMRGGQNSDNLPADVNGDGSVTTRDAIEILRNR